MVINQQARQTLHQYFGYEDFRGQQAEIIHSVLSGTDTLAVLPTGGGKSLCYQIPGLILPGMTLVITPLVSLMEDQVQALLGREISATYLSSGLSKKELKQRLKQINTYKFVYLTPERLASESWQEISRNLNISLIAVDEAHCIAQWGHDFRPPYLAIGKYLTSLNKRPATIALTATATPRTRAEICSRLNLNLTQSFITSPNRPNLSLFTLPLKTKFEQEFCLLLFLKNHSHEAGIIYAPTREKTEYLAELIKLLFPAFKIDGYHAGLSGTRRSTIQTQFLKNEITMIVATTAFGMGVDKPDIHFVVHFGVPTSIENYYQEIGRAGRDQKPAICYLFSHEQDWALARQLITGTSNFDLKNKLQKLRQLRDLLNATGCLHHSLRQYFSGRTHFSPNPKNCQKCQFCQPQPLYFSKSDQTLIGKLQTWRETQAQKQLCQPSAILTNQTLALIALTQPRTSLELLKLPGLGLGFVDRWANDIIHLI